MTELTSTRTSCHVSVITHLNNVITHLNDVLLAPRDHDAAVIRPTIGPGFPALSPTSCTTMSKRSVPRMTTSSCSKALRACSLIWIVVIRRSPSRDARRRLPNRQQIWLTAEVLGITCEIATG